MRASFRIAMDYLYLACVLLAGTSLVVIAFIIPWGVFTRYGLNSASSWPEAASVLLAIVMTFFGAAGCYRLGLHMRVSYVRDKLPPALGKVADVLAELIMLLIGGFMVQYGIGLCQTTWYQSIAEFPALSVGVTYLPIPLGGVCLMLFVLERLLIGRPTDTMADTDIIITTD